MGASCLEPDPALEAYDTVQTNDAGDLDSRALVSDRLPEPSRAYRYRLRERGLWRQHFAEPIFLLSIRRAGSLLASFGASRFATEVSVDDADGSLFGFTSVLSGSVVYRRCPAASFTGSATAPPPRRRTACWCTGRKRAPNC